jgi:NAD(P)-dependent dehydrogenase (short-subunit alcohol dehydrogenase family)
MVQDRFSGRVAVVTGAGSGIGSAVARRLAKEGATVALLDVNLEAARAVASEFCGYAIHADVSDSGAVDRAIDEAEHELGPLDVLVNNAGITTEGTVERVRERALQIMAEAATGATPTVMLDATVRLPDDEWVRLLSINLFGVFYCTRRALQTMQGRRSGSIVNIASVCGIEGCVGFPHYSASKGGVLAFTRSVAKEVVGYGVRINAVAPGFIDTPMAQASGEEVLAGFKLQIPQGRFGTPDEVAASVAFLASDEASYYVGETISPNGGFTTV